MISDKLKEDMKTAMKAGDKTRLGTIRMLLSELKNARIAKGDDLTEADEQKVLASYSKKRKESIETARSKLTEGRAAAKQARDSLKKIEATESEVKAAKAQVLSVSAALEVAKIRLKHTELRAPFKGILVSRNVEPGEVVTPGQEVLSLSDLSKVDLKVFVEETEIGKIQPGQKVDVKIDTFPSKTYAGHVSFISPEGEFTPKIIQTHKERVKLVYLVKIAIPNPNFELKSGMPADAWFR